MQKKRKLSNSNPKESQPKKKLQHSSKKQNNYQTKDLQQSFIVKKILDKKITKDKKVLYKILWQGYSYDDCTWEPLEHLEDIPKMVNEFNEMYDKAKQEGRSLSLDQNQQNILNIDKDNDNDKDKQTQLFEVEKIISHINKNNHRFKYLIKWKGFDSKSNSWKLATELKKCCPIIVQNYEKSLKKNQQKDQIVKIKYKPYAQFGVDIPEQICKLKMEANKLIALVFWKKRSDGYRPDESWHPIDMLKQHCPTLLLNYYEGKIVFHTTEEFLKKIDDPLAKVIKDTEQKRIKSPPLCNFIPQIQQDKPSCILNDTDFTSSFTQNDQNTQPVYYTPQSLIALQKQSNYGQQNSKEIDRQFVESQDLEISQFVQKNSEESKNGSDQQYQFISQSESQNEEKQNVIQNSSIDKQIKTNIVTQNNKKEEFLIKKQPLQPNNLNDGSNQQQQLVKNKKGNRNLTIQIQNRKLNANKQMKRSQSHKVIKN